MRRTLEACNENTVAARVGGVRLGERGVFVSVEGGGPFDKLKAKVCVDEEACSAQITFATGLNPNAVLRSPGPLWAADYAQVPVPHKGVGLLFERYWF